MAQQKQTPAGDDDAVINNEDFIRYVFREKLINNIEIKTLFKENEWVALFLKFNNFMNENNESNQQITAIRMELEACVQQYRVGNTEKKQDIVNHVSDFINVQKQQLITPQGPPNKSNINKPKPHFSANASTQPGGENDDDDNKQISVITSMLQTTTTTTPKRPGSVYDEYTYSDDDDIQGAVYEINDKPYFVPYLIPMEHLHLPAKFDVFVVADLIKMHREQIDFLKQFGNRCQKVPQSQKPWIRSKIEYLELLKKICSGKGSDKFGEEKQQSFFEKNAIKFTCAQYSNKYHPNVSLEDTIKGAYKNEIPMLCKLQIIPQTIYNVSDFKIDKKLGFAQRRWRIGYSGDSQHAVRYKWVSLTHLKTDEISVITSNFLFWYITGLLPQDWHLTPHYFTGAAKLPLSWKERQMQQQIKLKQQNSPF